jgi:hypothetical protein
MPTDSRSPSQARAPSVPPLRSGRSILQRLIRSARRRLGNLWGLIEIRSPRCSKEPSPDGVKPPGWQGWTFSRKVAWQALNPDPRVDYRTWVDKNRVKDLVRPLFNVAETLVAVDRAEDIDADRLPGSFVMKATHGWNMSLLVIDGIVQGGNRDLKGAGRKADTEYLRRVAQGWLGSKPEARRRLRERQYRFVEPGILFEQRIDPMDYEVQLFLFNGHCRFAMVCFRGFHHSGASHRLYDEHWQRLAPGSRESAACYEGSAEETAPPPAELLRRLEGLCREVGHVRADFFVSGGRYWFSEFSFTHNGGNGPGMIGRYDAELGRFWSG